MNTHRMHRRPSRMGLILSLAATLVAFGVSTAFAQTKVTDTKFQFNGFNYFRGKAEAINIASYGKKHTPVGKTNYVARHADVSRDNLANVEVDVSGPYNIDWSSFKNSDVNAKISYLTAAGGTASFSRQKAIDAKLKLVRFSLSEGALKKLLNQHAKGARNFLKGEGKGRIVSVTWVAMEAEMATKVKTCGSVSGAGTHSGFKIKLDLRQCGGSVSQVDIPPGTTFAYGAHKVKKWNKGKTKVEKLEDDQAGLN